jgi:archaellum component FlaC
MNDDCVKHYELEWLQEQIYELQGSIRDLETTVEQLQMENTLLHNDLNTIKTEGCYRFIEDPKHTHRSINE